MGIVPLFESRPLPVSKKASGSRNSPVPEDLWAFADHEVRSTQLAFDAAEHCAEPLHSTCPPDRYAGANTRDMARLIRSPRGGVQECCAPVVAGAKLDGPCTSCPS